MKLKYFYIILAVVGLGLTACEKDFMKDGDLSFSGTFSPYALAASSVNNTPRTKVEFNTAPNTKDCTIQFSTDSLNFEAPNLVFEETVPLTDINAFTQNKFSKIYSILAGDRGYFVRVKASSSIEGSPDSKWLMVKIKTPAENLFRNFLDQNGVTAKGEVTLVWDAGNNVTAMQFIGDDGSDTKYPITADESAAGRKVIQNIKLDVTYTINILNGSIIRGSQQIKVEDASIIKTDADLATAIAAAQDGDVLILQGGLTFNLGNTTLSSGVILRGGAGNTKPILNIGTLTLPAQASSVEFDNIDLRGSGTYLFNQSAACNVAALKFTNSTVSKFSNTLLRLQGSNAVSIGSLIIDNCIMTTVASGSYALIHASGAGPAIQNISVSNSTLYNLGGAFIRLEGSKTGTLQTVNVSNVTLVGFAGHTMRLNGTQCNAANVTISNSIIGNASSVSGAQKATGMKDITVDNSFKTGDYVETSNAIAGLTLYGKEDPKSTVNDLFVDPAKGDFHFKDESFAGKLTAGDPRWK